MMLRHYAFYFFFFNDTATTEIYTLSLHDALPISQRIQNVRVREKVPFDQVPTVKQAIESAQKELDGNGRVVVRYSGTDRKSTRLNSSHGYISYAVFCLKKKKKV